MQQTGQQALSAGEAPRMEAENTDEREEEVSTEFEQQNRYLQIQWHVKGSRPQLASLGDHTCQEPPSLMP